MLALVNAGASTILRPKDLGSRHADPVGGVDRDVVRAAAAAGRCPVECGGAVAVVAERDPRRVIAGLVQGGSGEAAGRHVERVVRSGGERDLVRAGNPRGLVDVEREVLDDRNRTIAVPRTRG